MALDRKDEARKALERVNEATLRGQSLQDALKSQQKFLKANLDEATYNKLFDAKGDAKWTNANLTEFSKLRDDTTKSVSGMEKVHESIRKQYQEDAAVEDAIKFVKYNKVDPSEPTKPAADFPELATSAVNITNPSSSTGTTSTNSANSTTSSGSQANSLNTPTAADDSSPIIINADSDWPDMDAAFDRNANSTSQGSSSFEYTSSDKKENAQQRLEELLAEIRTIDPNSSEEAKKRYKELSAEIEKIERSL